MLAKTITSLQHPIVKHWYLLRTERPYREDAQRLLLVGEKMIRELSKEIPILALATLHPEDGIPAKEKYLITEPILAKITGLEHPDGYAAEVLLPPPQNLFSKKFLVVFDQISDPGNLGTLLRTALALNWEGAILTTPGTVDLFNDKALRAGKGAPFRLPYARLQIEEISRWIEEKQPLAFTADTRGDSLDQVAGRMTAHDRPIVLILSNEAQGPGLWTKNITQKVTIPMNPGVESLNVAASGAILLYAMRPKR